MVAWERIASLLRLGNDDLPRHLGGRLEHVNAAEWSYGGDAYADEASLAARVRTNLRPRYRLLVFLGGCPLPVSENVAHDHYRLSGSIRDDGLEPVKEQLRFGEVVFLTGFALGLKFVLEPSPPRAERRTVEAKKLPAPRRRYPRRDDRINRRRLETLERRADFLESRIESSDGAAQYDEAEFSALRWALEALKAWMRQDPNWVFEPHPDAKPGDRAGGAWRELRVAYWDENKGEWLLRPSKRTIRPATDEEIAEAKAEGENEYIGD